MADPPSQSEISAEIRLELIRRARDKKRPTEVLNPECNIPFTDISAWHFVADRLEEGCAVAIVILRKPPDKIGYEMRLPGSLGQPQIYVKVRLHGNRIIGRSFHNSTREAGQNA